MLLFTAKDALFSLSRTNLYKFILIIIQHKNLTQFYINNFLSLHINLEKKFCLKK